MTDYDAGARGEGVKNGVFRMTSFVNDPFLIPNSCFGLKTGICHYFQSQFFHINWY